MLAKQIFSLQHPIIKKCVKLRTSKKIRYQKKQLLLSGRKIIEELGKVDILLTTSKEHFSCQTKELYFVSTDILIKITGQTNPEPFAAVAPLPEFQDLRGKKRLLALDRIKDPGNLGTLIRTACGLDYEGVFLIDGCADPFNSKTLRASMGAVLHLPIQIGSAENLFDLASDYSPFVADIEGAPLNKIQPEGRPLLLLGSESHGVSQEFKKAFPLISIPTKKIESLNVSAAGAIILYHFSHER